MSLSDCPECWNTPCTCGHDWKGTSKRYLLCMIGGMFLELLHTGGWFKWTQQRLDSKPRPRWLRRKPVKPEAPAYKDLVPGADPALDARVLARWGAMIEQSGLADLPESEKLEIAYLHENMACRRGVFAASKESVVERAAAGTEDGPAVQV